jgi:hypothetical protein
MLLDIYWNILAMHGLINVKSPNNTSKRQMGFNSAFKGLKAVSLFLFVAKDHHHHPANMETVHLLKRSSLTHLAPFNGLPWFLLLLVCRFYYYHR